MPVQCHNEKGLYGVLDKCNTMKHQSIIKTLPLNGESKLSDLQQSLELIEHKLDHEVQAKQNTIERLEMEIDRLQSIIGQKDTALAELNEKLSDCTRNNEGNKQLINKLLNEIDRLNQDIEWYKRTFEKRSFLGTIKEKFLRKSP